MISYGYVQNNSQETTSAAITNNSTVTTIYTTTCTSASRTITIILGNGIGDPGSNPEWGRLCSLYINDLEKGMNPFVLHQDMSKTQFFNQDKITSLGKGKLWIQTSCTRIKNGPAHSAGVR